MNGPERIRAALAKPGPHVVAYLMAGDPGFEASLAHARALADVAAVLEVGVAFSDPVADGPTIQQAATRALRAGAHPADAFRLVRALRVHSDVPVCLMTYYNILHRMGLEAWVRRAREAGVDGVVVPDLPVDEAMPLLSLSRTHGLATNFLATPNTDDARLDRIAHASSGFLYLVSVYGVTGARAALPDSTLQLVQRVKKRTAGRVPLAVGFGVSRPEQVRALHAAGADAVVVGSAIVERIARGETPERVAGFVRALR